MGFFRRYKAKRHDLADVKKRVAYWRDRVRRAAQLHADDTELEENLTTWACWRELQARLEGENSDAT